MIGRAATALAGWLAVLMAVEACGAGAPQAVLPADARIDDDTTLHVGDTFEVTVYGEADLSGKYRVAEDGTITFPLIGRLLIEGQHAVEVGEMVRAALVERGILRTPNVSVFVIERQAKQISIMGAVAKPGTYQLTTGMSLVQVIGNAGGLTPLARGSDAVLTRQVGGTRKRFRVDVEGITEGRAPDVALQAGDILFVPARIF